MSHYSTNLEHLRDEFRRLDWLLERAIQQFRSHRNSNIPTEFQGLHISDEEIDDLISTEQPPQSPAKTQTNVMSLHAQIQQRVAETQTSGIILRLPYLQLKTWRSLLHFALLKLAEKLA